MKVILLKDVLNLGRRYEVLTVSDGYARNFLLPQKLAVAATSALQQWAVQQQDQVKHLQHQQQNFKAKLGEKLQNQRLVIRVKANEQGKLYEGVHVEQIIKAIKQQFNIELHNKDIKLDQPIKKLGTYAVKIQTSPAVQTTIEVLVRPLTNKPTVIPTEGPPKLQRRRGEVEGST